MIVTYTEVPADAGGTPRPVLDVNLADMRDVAVPCLVDSGAVSTLLPSWVATIAGIDLGGAQSRELAVAGSSTTARFLPTRLTVAEFTWEAPVGFCQPWTPSWGLLGHEAFFRYFTVSFRAADWEFEIEPIRS